jgi:hypothetical protein
MKTKLASLSVLLVGVAALPGCATECHDDPETGRRVCTAENAVRYNGTPESLSDTYTPGTEIQIDGVNGNLDIRSDGPADQISVTFKPFSFRGNDPEDRDLAKQDMEDDLSCTIANNRIDCDRESGANDALGADMEIVLPAGFADSVSIVPGNGYVNARLPGTQSATRIDIDGSGDIEATGVSGTVEIGGDFDIDVELVDQTLAGGTISSPELLGSVRVSVLQSANGSIVADADDGVIGPSPLPETWTEEPAGTFTFGTGGGRITVTSGETVTIEAR